MVIAAHVLELGRFQKHILFHSDNEAVVAILNARTSRVPELMHLVQHFLLCAARFHFSFAAHHIPGVHNGIADALSRFNWQESQRLALSAPLNLGLLHSRNAMQDLPNTWFSFIHQQRASSLASVRNLANNIPLVPPATRVNGHCISLPHSLCTPCSTRPSRSIYRQ